MEIPRLQTTGDLIWSRKTRSNRPGRDKSLRLPKPPFTASGEASGTCTAGTPIQAKAGFLLSSLSLSTCSNSQGDVRVSSVVKTRSLVTTYKMCKHCCYGVQVSMDTSALNSQQTMWKLPLEAFCFGFFNLNTFVELISLTQHISSA